MRSIKSLSLLFVFVLFCSGAKLVSSCTQDEFDVKAKECLMNEFFNTIKENPKQNCSVAYLAMKNCIKSVLYGCKNNTDPAQNLTNIDSRARIVIGSEKYFCRYGMLNSFKRINLQPDCPKKATKKVKNCAASFHKQFSEDKASPSLCRKYTKAKSCVKNVVETFCKKTERTRSIIVIYEDPFNPYCPGSVDRRKKPVRSPINPFGTCSAREYFILTRVCMRRFIQTLQENPKKPCRSVFTKKLYNCAKEFALYCHKNESKYVKQNIERSFARNRAFQQSKYCEGVHFQLSYPSLKHNKCKDTYFLEKHKCEGDYVMSYKVNKADKSLCQKYAEAKRCAKNATLALCKASPSLRDEVNFIYDRFNPFCDYLSDPPASKGPGVRLPRESGPQRPAKASTVPSDSISRAAQQVTPQLLTFVVPLYFLFIGVSFF